VEAGEALAAMLVRVVCGEEARGTHSMCVAKGSPSCLLGMLRKHLGNAAPSLKRFKAIVQQAKPAGERKRLQLGSERVQAYTGVAVKVAADTALHVALLGVGRDLADAGAFAKDVGVALLSWEQQTAARAPVAEVAMARLIPVARAGDEATKQRTPARRIHLSPRVRKSAALSCPGAARGGDTPAATRREPRARVGVVGAVAAPAGALAAAARTRRAPSPERRAGCPSCGAAPRCALTDVLAGVLCWRAPPDAPLSAALARSTPAGGSGGGNSGGGGGGGSSLPPPAPWAAPGICDMTAEALASAERCLRSPAEAVVLARSFSGFGDLSVHGKDMWCLDEPKSIAQWANDEARCAAALA
jgi:hypothetical protein